MKWRYRQYIKGRPIKQVAFYDRASTRRQADNYIRHWYSDAAIEISDFFGWNLVASDQNPNGYGCFLDVMSGFEAQRPKLQRLLEDENIDTIAFFAFDRLARNLYVYQIIEKEVRQRNKNLICVMSEEDYYSKERELELQIASLMGLTL